MQSLKVGNILITSAANKIPLVRAVLHAAKKLHPGIKVIAGDVDVKAASRYIADDFWLIPRTIDDEVNAFLFGCKEKGIRTIIPTRDGELFFWARHKEKFIEQGIDIVVSPKMSVEVCIDKLAFSQFGEAHGMPFIPAGLNPDQVGQGPYVVKERYGAGSRNMGLNLNRNQAIEHGALLEVPIYQPFVVGIEISIDAWLDHRHLVKGLVCRTRDKVVNGESQVTTTFRNEGIEKQVTNILQELKLRGPVVLQAFIDGDNNLHIIECNARFGGASTTSIAVGLDIFYWSLLETYGADLSEYPFDRLCGEVRQIRVNEDIYQYGSDF